MDRGQTLDIKADHASHSRASRSPAGRRAPTRPGVPDAADDAREAEGKRRVARDPLVQHVPRREPKPRLEHEHDRGRVQEEPEDEAHGANDEPAPDPRVAHACVPSRMRQAGLGSSIRVPRARPWASTVSASCRHRSATSVGVIQSLKEMACRFAAGSPGTASTDGRSNLPFPAARHGTNENMPSIGLSGVAPK